MKHDTLYGIDLTLDRWYNVSIVQNIWKDTNHFSFGDVNLQ